MPKWSTIGPVARRSVVAALACALACVDALRGATPADAQALSASAMSTLAADVARYAQFASARTLTAADRERIEAAETSDLARRPADAAVDARVSAFLASVATLQGPALEAARTSAWNSIVAGARAGGPQRDPVTATVLRYNPVVASDPRTGIAVSMHALQGYTSSLDMTARLGGHPALANLDANRIAPALASTFSTYSPEAQRMVADGAERWIALKERVDGESSGQLATLRRQLAAGTLTPDGVAQATQLLESSAMRDTFGDMLSQTRAAFSAAMSAFGSGRVFAP